MVNNCIGVRNMRSFVLLVFTSFTLALLILISTILVIVKAIEYGFIYVSVVKDIVIVAISITSIPLFYSAFIKE
jgi:hypothetical protein